MFPLYKRWQSIIIWSWSLSISLERGNDILSSNFIDFFNLFYKSLISLRISTMYLFTVSGNSTMSACHCVCSNVTQSHKFLPLIIAVDIIISQMIYVSSLTFWYKRFTDKRFFVNYISRIVSYKTQYGSSISIILNVSIFFDTASESTWFSCFLTTYLRWYVFHCSNYYISAIVWIQQLICIFYKKPL